MNRALASCQSSSRIRNCESTTFNGSRENIEAGRAARLCCHPCSRNILPPSDSCQGTSPCQVTGRFAVMPPTGDSAGQGELRQTGEARSQGEHAGRRIRSASGYAPVRSRRLPARCDAGVARKQWRRQAYAKRRCAHPFRAGSAFSISWWSGARPARASNTSCICGCPGGPATTSSCLPTHEKERRFRTFEAVQQFAVRFDYLGPMVVYRAGDSALARFKGVLVSDGGTVGPGPGRPPKSRAPTPADDNAADTEEPTD